ncbi:MAG TPA: preprotein translocase subunit SecG [Noviherbaspirillum sp.]|jgi:preprotein translocase subunit SecG|uniref:preprotein translocase subunit SecG n=1 Tax=Noviherbaspirillum sp. TaxID=1926288 RepID=UPI002DDD7B54|nr:preprotein translocase subunit SecG [Noviherbaspirillum sp.]HEV2612400.1 preprotein translocase subunit SecG [Noviherbaspirillum sp.]
MNALFTFIVVLQVVSALVIIGLVLIQHGKGADMGAAFGSGASGSLFGATGSSNFLSKSTGVAAAVFFAATLALALIGNKYGSSGAGVMDRLPASSVPATSPAAPATGAPAANTPVPSNAAPSTPATAPAPAAPAAGGGQANQIPK